MYKLLWEMCSSPKETIKKVLGMRNKKIFYFLAILYGLPIVFHLMQEFSWGVEISFVLLWMFGLLLALPVGMLGIYIAGGILYWVGRLLKGAATQKELRKAFAWSNVPLILTFIAWVGLTLIFRSKLFLYSFVMQEFTLCEEISVLIFALLQFAATLWSLFLLLNVLTVVQRFSMTKAVVNVVIPFLAFLIWMALAR